MRKLIDFIVALFFAIIALIYFEGCTHQKQIVTETKTVYQDIYVPVKCKYKIILRPKKEDDIVINTINLIEYIEKLENILNVCMED